MKRKIDEAMHRLEDLLALGGTKKDIWLLAISGVALLISIFEPPVARDAFPVDPAWVAIVLCGIPIICEALIGLVTEFDITADVLVALALMASVAIGETFAAGEVAFIMQLGGLLEELTVARARAGIEKLVHLTPRTARRISCPGEALADAVSRAAEAAHEQGSPAGSALEQVAREVAANREETIPAEDVQVGDILRVNPGETVPVDGVIVSGQTSIDQAVMTGESMPVDKGPGDEVSSGTINRFGSFDMRAVKVGEDSSIQRMIALVQSADAGKAKIVNLADRWAVWIVVIALTAAAITWAVTGEIIRAVTILVVFCPCALVLATPTAIMAAIGNATKHGFLVREGDALERLAKVDRVAFDKTGTLTYGTPKVVAVECEGAGVEPDGLYALAASAELKSEHPLGRAIVAGWRAAQAERQGENGDPQAVGDTPAAAPVAVAVAQPLSFQMVPGRGVAAVCAQGEAGAADGRVRVLAGNRELMTQHGLALPERLLASAQEHLDRGCTVTYLALVPADEPLPPTDTVPVATDADAVGAAGRRERISFGYIALSDTPRRDADRTVAGIRSAGAEPVLLTGDNPAAAGAVAGGLGIREFKAECRPEDKLAWIEASEAAGHPVCMVGDGVNDAPALKRAQVGIAMGGVGSDIAVDAADIALVNDDVRELPHLLALSHRMMTTIKLNMTFSLTLNFIAIVLAITGILNPVVGALVHNAGSVLVITNSALLLGWKRHV